MGAWRIYFIALDGAFPNYSAPSVKADLETGDDWPQLVKNANVGANEAAGIIERPRSSGLYWTDIGEKNVALQCWGQ